MHDVFGWRRLFKAVPFDVWAARRLRLQFSSPQLSIKYQQFLPEYFLAYAPM
jgi:hypothetical protein